MLISIVHFNNFYAAKVRIKTHLKKSVFLKILCIP